jgi:hypothetical protein
MKRNRKKTSMLEALRNTLGNVTMACKVTNITRQTHYEWMHTDPDYKTEVESILDEQGDFVENKLLQAIKDGDTTAIIFYCKTKLKNRGYTEKQEVDMNADITITVAEGE